MHFDFYFSFRSPYSYLALPQIETLLRTHAVSARMRIVLPIAVRIPGFFQRANPQWLPYLMRDTVRVAEVMGAPFRWPRPDPIVQDRETRVVAAEQPYIHRLSRLGAAAEAQGAGFPFVLRAATMIWDGGVDNWHEGRRLAEAADAAGLDGDALERSVSESPEVYDAMIAENQALQERAGHWGVPLFVFEDEPFFGQDRIGHLAYRLRQRGVQVRGG